MSGCVDAVCTRLCPWAAGTTDELGELRREPGARVSRAVCQGEGWLAGLARGSRLVWGLDWDLSPGPEGCYGQQVCVFLGVVSLFLCDWVSRFVCPNVCLHFHISMYTHGNVCTSMCGHVHSHLWPPLSMSMFNCRHNYVAPYLSLLCFTYVCLRI